MAGQLERRLATFVASVAYLGYSPLAPGTVGTLGALAVYWWLLPADDFVIIATAVLAAGAGIWAGGVAEKTWGKKDPGRVCVDEFAGYFVAVAFLPKTLAYAVFAFVLFRAFDILKPFPAGRSQRLPGGWGIMADDVIAAVYANLVLQTARVLARATGLLGNVFT
jgi:phosphatidylglycerophosphatase A